MYNITTEIGGSGGQRVEADAVAVTVRIDAKRGTASITTSAFERDGIEYAVNNPTDPPRYRVDAGLIGRRVLEAAGAEGLKPAKLPAPPAGYLDEIEDDDETDDLQKWRAFAFAWVRPRRRCSDLREELNKLLRRLTGGDNAQSEIDQLRAALDEAREPRLIQLAEVLSELENAKDCLAEAFRSYCRENPDPDHLPEAWVDTAQELLGHKRASAVYEEAVAWPSLSVMGAPAAFEIAAQWLDFNGGPFDASAARRLRDASREKRGSLPNVAIVPLPPRKDWPEGMNTESPNGEPCVQFDGWMRTPGRVRDIAAALLSAANEADARETASTEAE